MFLPNWSLKAEYLYYDLGRMAGSVVNTYTGFGDAAGETGIQSITNYSGRASGNIVRAGVNYHFNFGAAPVVAKY
jgi:outer membrane immunogenic protein